MPTMTINFTKIQSTRANLLYALARAANETKGEM